MADHAARNAKGEGLTCDGTGTGRVSGLIIVAMMALASPAYPQNAPPANAPRVDPAQVAAAKAFEAFDPAERRAIQRDLIWVANFTGAATGEFGPLTFAALKRFEAEAKRPQDGLLTSEERQLLRRMADAGRKAFVFVIETDPTSKMRIGVPTRILAKRSTGPAGLSRWQDSGEVATLDLSLGKPDDKLEALFERGTANNVPGRKITYKLLRPDFFVISGETETASFIVGSKKGRMASSVDFRLATTRSSPRNSTGWSSRWPARSRPFRVPSQQASQRVERPRQMRRPAHSARPEACERGGNRAGQVRHRRQCRSLQEPRARQCAGDH